MRTVELVLAAGWLIFWTYWIAAAFTAERGRVAWSHELRIRAVVAVVVVVLDRLGVFREYGLNTDPWRAGVGLVLFVVGLAFAVWARRHIGRNWGSPMSRKKEPQLVTTGPYRLVRHPIYTGILTAGVGTAIALGWTWLVAVGLIGTYFVYSAVVEERTLVRQLPESYPAYQHATKMMVPFLL